MEVAIREAFHISIKMIFLQIGYADVSITHYVFISDNSFRPVTVQPVSIPSGLKTGSAAGLYDNRNYAIIRKVEDVGPEGYHYL